MGSRLSAGIALTLAFIFLAQPIAAEAAKKPRPRISVSKSPSPKWPPIGFSQQGEVYAKIPSVKELVGIISADKTKALYKQSQSCKKYICGSVQAAAETGCDWWEVETKFTTSKNRVLGLLITRFGSAKPRAIKTFITVSPELVKDGGTGKVTAVTCNHGAMDPTLALSEYKKSQ